MPGLVPGIHVLTARRKEDVDGRDKPRHDNRKSLFCAEGARFNPASHNP
jgi:hypothetical protein